MAIDAAPVLSTKSISVRGGSTGKIDPRIARLQKEHELVSLFKDRWEFYLNSFEGGEDFCVSANLFRYAREQWEDYNDRVGRLAYHNYVYPVVTFFSNFIFSEEVTRSCPEFEEEYSTFVKNVNRRGDTMDVFMRDAEDLCQVFGHIDVLTDKERMPNLLEGEALTKQQEEELGLVNPYCLFLYPHEGIDWILDKFGNFTYYKRKEEISEENGIEFQRYTEWTPETITITEVQYDENKPGKSVVTNEEVYPNALGVVPIVRVFYRKSKKHRGIGISFIRDIAYINRRILNITSQIDEFLAKQCYSFLAREAESGVAFADQNKGDVGTSNVMEYPKGASVPVYVAPPVDPAQYLQSEREKCVLEIYRACNLDTSGEIFTGQSKSGDAQAQSFSRTVPAISSRAESLEVAEVQIARMWLRWLHPDSKVNIKISYRDDYSITSIMSLILQLKMIIFDMKIPSKTFILEEFERIAREYDGKISHEKMTLILAELKENVTDDYVKNLTSGVAGANNLKGLAPAINLNAQSAQAEQGATQETLGNNMAISAMGADRVTNQDSQNKRK